MKNRTYVNEAKDYVGQEVTVAGSVHAMRDQSKIIFILLRDVTGIIQAVAFHKDEEAFAIAKDLSNESVVKITGTVKEETQAPGGYEIGATNIEILSKADPVLPIPIVSIKGGAETEAPVRFDHRWIDLRKPEKTKIFKVWTELERGIREYFEKENWIQIYSPSFMGTPSETGADVFEIEYFGKKAYLAQSPQFYKQMAISAGFDKVFTVGTVFRAEKSFTTRHTTEFTGWDFEQGFIDSHHDIMDTEEGMLVSAVKKLNERMPEVEIEVPSQPFPRIPFSEAKEMLKDAGLDSEEAYDMSPEEERKLSELVKEKYNHDYVFITDYHISKRPFYHMRHSKNPDLTKSFDLLYRGIEVTTGAQREHRVEVLEKQALEKGMKLELLKDYIDFFRYGCPPHGGIGFGPSRWIMKILDLPNVREATFLPRDIKRLNP